MKSLWSHVLYGVLLFLVVFQFATSGLPAAAIDKGKLVIDGRVTLDVEVARTAKEQAKGLGGRSFLKKGTGMVFPYDEPRPRPFWMKGMLIPIDILWVQEGRIMAIEERVPAPSVNIPLAVYTHQADLVLEVPAGYVQEKGIRVGQPVEVRYR